MRSAGKGRLRLPWSDLCEVKGLVEQLRREVGVEEDEAPAIRDAWRVAALYADRLEILFRNRRAAITVLHLDGTATLWLPEGLEEALLERNLLEELGHFLLTVQAFAALPPKRGAQQLYKLWEQRDESRVRAFVLLWLLPAMKLLEFIGREAELAELCRCEEQDIWDRLSLEG